MGSHDSPGAGQQDGEPAGQDDRSVIRRAVALAAVGNAMEWYDFSVVTLYSAQFFQGGLFKSNILLLLGFLMRTPGGIILGPIGDKIGRKRILVWTVLMMSGGTFLVGCLPTFKDRLSFDYGVLALLIVLRLVQGLSTGGEYVGAATLMAEYAPAKKRGFYGSFLEVGTLTGFITGAMVVLAITHNLDPRSHPFLTWGWRIPFWLALPFGVIGLYLRLKIGDTPTFQAAKAAAEAGGRPGKLTPRAIITEYRAIIAGYWRVIRNLIGIVLLLNIAYYLLLTWIPKYFSESLKLNDTASTLTLVGVEVVMLVSLPFLGALSDRIGRRPLLITSAVGFIALSYPSFRLMSHGAHGHITHGHITGFLITGFLILGLLLALLQSVIASTFPAMFPTLIRYGAFALGYNLSTSVFGGTADPIAGSLHNHPIAGPAFYLILAAAIALIPILRIPETAKVPMDQI